jgi:hypothetical protein
VPSTVPFQPTVSVQAIPVVSSLALEPLSGLNAKRSSTLQFQAIGRRPPSTIATTPIQDTFPGYNQYVSIPAAACATCVAPSYSFTSSNPIVGNFVQASTPGSPYPALTASGAAIPSSQSGLFCAFNPGTTTVTVTSGLLSSSLPVTVANGGSGPPCGTVAGGKAGEVIKLSAGTKRSTASIGGLNVPPPATKPTKINPATPHINVPRPPAPIPTPTPAPAPTAPPPAPVPKPTPVHRVPTPRPLPLTPAVTTFPLVPGTNTLSPSQPAIVPPPPPASTPIPPGGATVPAAAKREEKAKKEAQQSAYVIRPAGVSATDWFYPAVGGFTLLSLLLVAAGARPGPRKRYAYARVRNDDTFSSSRNDAYRRGRR